MEKEVRMKLSPPWITTVNMIQAMFEEDKDINIIYNNDFHTIKIYTNDVDKAQALGFIMNWSKNYGNICLDIQVIPPNAELKAKEIDWHNTQLVYETAFKGNPVFSFARTVQGLFSNKITYIVFKNKVVQFFNDDLNDIYGNMTTLYEDIARDIFNEDALVNKGICYCTDLPEGLKKPPVEWP